MSASVEQRQLPLVIHQCHYCGHATSRLCPRCRCRVYCNEGCEKADKSHAEMCRPVTETSGGGFDRRGAIVRFQAEHPKDWAHALNLLEFILMCDLPRVLVVKEREDSGFDKFILTPEQLRPNLAPDTYATPKNMFNTRKPGQLCWMLVMKDNNIVMERLRMAALEDLPQEFHEAADAAKKSAAEEKKQTQA